MGVGKIKYIFPIKFQYNCCSQILLVTGDKSILALILDQCSLSWTCAFFTQCIMNAFYFYCFSVWVLVLFESEEVPSHPLPLGEVQDLSGRNGEEADLQEGDQCMARYNVGDELSKAIIFKRSGEMVMWLS